MATNMDPDSEVIFKEKEEEKGIKGEGTTEDATIRFDFRASTLAIPAMTQPEGRAEPERVRSIGRSSLRNSASGRKSTMGRSTSKDW